MLEQISAWIGQTNPVVFYSLVMLFSLLIVIKSSDLLVYGIGNYAKKLGISDYLIGFIVVSIGTALPELIAAITGTTLGQGEVVFGTVFGSNIFKIPLLGLILVIVKKIKIRNDVGTAPITTIFMALMPFLMILDGKLGRIDGILLLLAFFFYIFRLWKGEGEMGSLKEDVKLRKIWKDAIIFLGSLVALLLSARWLVIASIELSDNVNIAPYLIGLIVIGIGTSAPEFMVQLRSILVHKQNLAFGNVLGSIVANSTFVFGIAALVKPINIVANNVLLTFIFLMIGLIYTLSVMLKEKLTFKHGIVMILIYIIFLIIQML